jgi:hypothetical protein
MGGRMLMESVAGSPWTRWPNVRGLGGRMVAEYAILGMQLKMLLG